MTGLRRVVAAYTRYYRRTVPIWKLSSVRAPKNYVRSGLPTIPWRSCLKLACPLNWPSGPLKNNNVTMSSHPGRNYERLFWFSLVVYHFNRPVNALTPVNTPGTNNKNPAKMDHSNVVLQEILQHVLSLHAQTGPEESVSDVLHVTCI